MFTTVEIKDDIFHKYKLYNLKVFRKFFLMPKIKTLIFQSLQIDYNINTMHRLIFMKDIREFFIATNLEMENFFKFLTRISNSIVNYFTKISEEELNKLIKEYLRFIYIIINYKMPREKILMILNDLYLITDLISSII